MTKVIGIAAQKGGVGKSTTCRNVATELANRGYKVLAIDCDNLSRIMDKLSYPEDIIIPKNCLT